MKPTVYVETTIPSYYCDDRAELAADIARSREWWNSERAEYLVFISAVVLDELAAGDYPSKSRCLGLVADLPLLAVQSEVIQIARCTRPTE